QRHPEEVWGASTRGQAGLEGPQAAIEEIAIDDVRREVGRHRDEDRRELDLDGTPSTAPHHVETGVDEQSMKPGVETVDVAQRRQVPPASDHRLLDGVSRELTIAEDQASGSVQPRDGPAGEHGEGVMIATVRSLDESSLVHGRLRTSARPRWPCSTSYGAVVIRIVPGERGSRCQTLPFHPIREAGRPVRSSAWAARGIE